MHQPNAEQQPKADLDLEEAEGYLWRAIFNYEQAWPEHYREAAARMAVVLAKHLDNDQGDEVLDVAAELVGAAETVQLRIGFMLGRLWGAFGELTEADICRAVEAAGGNPGRALAEVVEEQLAGVIQ
jgi:hypothetical protein